MKNTSEIMNFKDFLISKIKSILTKKSLLKSIISATIRNFMRIRIVFKFVFKATEKFSLEKIQNFLHIRIGFLFSQGSYPNYIDLDYWSKPDNYYLTNLRKLPFKQNTIEEIYINRFFHYFPKKSHWKKAIKNWYKILIPGGKLKLLYSKNNSQHLLDVLIKLLKSSNFKFLESKSERILDLESENLYNLTFFKKYEEKELLRIKQKKLNEKLNIITLIVNNLKKNYYQNKNVAIIGKNNINFKNIKENATNVKVYSTFEEIVKIQHETFEFGIIYDFLEYFFREDLKKFLLIIKKVFKPQSKIFLIVPYRCNFLIKDYSQLFNKAILTEILDEAELEIDWINLDASFKLIKTIIINEEPFPSEISPIKIAVLGNLEPRYSQLNSFWDGHIRALLKLGYKPLLLDIRTTPFSEILRRIKIFNPDYLLTGDHAAIEFLERYSKFFRNNSICVSYWYRDVRTPRDINFNGIIDYMFLTNQGQIEEYKKKYHIRKVYYLPQWCNPQFSRPNPFIEEKYEIGFSGQLDFEPFHKERTNLLIKLNRLFNLKIENAEYNSVSEFYSQCKIVIGNDMGFHRLFGKSYPTYDNSFNKFVSLYASNRIFISIGCGTCYFINYFPGIENLFVNEKHLVWYKTYEELIELIKRYLSNDDKRAKIKREAFKLAKEKHTHIHRIKNVLDIIMGKNKEFFGFLKK